MSSSFKTQARYCFLYVHRCRTICWSTRNRSLRGCIPEENCLRAMWACVFMYRCVHTSTWRPGVDIKYLSHLLVFCLCEGPTDQVALICLELTEQTRLALNYLPLPPEYCNKRHESLCLFIVVVVLFRQGLLLNLEFARLVRMIGQQSPSALLTLHLPH